MGISVIGGATGAAAGGIVPKEKAFNTSSTWTVPEGVTRVEATVVGAAGGSGNSSLGSGAGGYWKGAVEVTPGDIMPVTVGAGTIGNNQGGYSQFGPIRAMGSKPAEAVYGATGETYQLTAGESLPGIGEALAGAVEGVITDNSSYRYARTVGNDTVGYYTFWLGNYQGTNSRLIKCWDSQNKRFITVSLDTSLGSQYGGKVFYWPTMAPNHIFFWNSYGPTYFTWGALPISDITGWTSGTVNIPTAESEGFYLPNQIDIGTQWLIDYRELDGKLWLFYRNNQNGTLVSPDITVYNNFTTIPQSTFSSSVQGFYPYGIEVDKDGGWWAMFSENWSTGDGFLICYSGDNGTTWAGMSGQQTFTNPGLGDTTYYSPNGWNHRTLWRYLNSYTSGANTYYRFISLTMYAQNNSNPIWSQIRTQVITMQVSGSAPIYIADNSTSLNSSGFGITSDATTTMGYVVNVSLDDDGDKLILSVSDYTYAKQADIMPMFYPEGVAGTGVNPVALTPILNYEDNQTFSPQRGSMPNYNTKEVYHTSYTASNTIAVSSLYKFAAGIYGSWTSNYPNSSGAGSAGTNGSASFSGQGGAPAPDGLAGGSTASMNNNKVNRPGWGHPPSYNYSSTPSNDGVVILRWAE